MLKLPQQLVIMVKAKEVFKLDFIIAIAIIIAVIIIMHCFHQTIFSSSQ